MPKKQTSKSNLSKQMSDLRINVTLISVNLIMRALCNAKITDSQKRLSKRLICDANI